MNMDYNEKYKKHELEDLIFNKNKSYKEIGRIYNVSDTYIKKVSKRLGIVLPIRAKFNENFKPSNFGTGKTIQCLFCDKEINTSYDKQLFCNKDCYGEYKSIEFYKKYLLNQNDFCSVNRDNKPFKKHILKEQNNCCAICSNTNIWNDKLIIFVLDHIDGNASNNLRENLRLICPNCDSQLDTYKSKNKNSARKDRYLKSYKN